MKNFLKEVKLINNGYLVNTNDEPVTHAEFEKAQHLAEYVCTFSEMSVNKNFKSTKADSLSDFADEVRAKIANNAPRVYLDKKDVSTGELTSKLAEEAMNFMKNMKENDKIGKINDFMQQFNVLVELEEFGLLFESGVTKLNKIYTIAEIKEAVTKVIDLV